METTEEEEAATAAYKKFIQESEVSKATKETAIEGKKGEIASLKVQINQVSEDITNTEAELEAVQQTLDTLTKECANKAMSYEERKAAREAELEGLNQALEILSADSAAEFLQTKATFLARN